MMHFNEMKSDIATTATAAAVAAAAVGQHAPQLTNLLSAVYISMPILNFSSRPAPASWSNMCARLQHFYMRFELKHSAANLNYFSCNNKAKKQLQLQPRTVVVACHSLWSTKLIWQRKYEMWLVWVCVGALIFGSHIPMPMPLLICRSNCLLFPLYSSSYWWNVISAMQSKWGNETDMSTKWRYKWNECVKRQQKLKR